MKSYTCTPLYYIYALFIMHKVLFRAKKFYPMSVSWYKHMKYSDTWLYIAINWLKSKNDFFLYSVE